MKTNSKSVIAEEWGVKWGGRNGLYKGLGKFGAVIDTFSIWIESARL